MIAIISSSLFIILDRDAIATTRKLVRGSAEAKKYYNNKTYELYLLFIVTLIVVDNVFIVVREAMYYILIFLVKSCM